MNISYLRSRHLRRVRRTPTPTEPVVQRLTREAVQLARHDPSQLGPQEILALQHTIGNEAVQRLLDSEEPAAKTDSSPAPAGRALPPDIQAKMEDAFDDDFSSVRVHQGSEAEALEARAFTQGNHIHFAQRQYDPHSHSGQTVLAHELTHVVQQRSGRVAGGSGSGPVINNDAGLEAEAHKAARSVVSGGTANVVNRSPDVQQNPTKTVQRWKWPWQRKKKKKNKSKSTKPKPENFATEKGFRQADAQNLVGMLEQTGLW